jgi:hypothetical protein
LACSAAIGAKLRHLIARATNTDDEGDPRLLAQLRDILAGLLTAA